MKPSMRRASWFAVILLAAALGGVAPAFAAGSGTAQTAPAAQSPPSPAREITYEKRADVYMARKNYDDAVDYYQRAIKQEESPNPMLWNKLGIAYQQQGKFGSASKAYKRAIRADKNFAEAWNNMGTVLFMEKKYRKSVSYYQRAIKLDADVATFHMNLGASYYHMKKYQQAVEEYRTALGIDPKVLTPRTQAGVVVSAGGADVEYYFCLAKALASVGRAEDAVRYLRHAFENGFHDRKRIEQDPDFQRINQYPAFVELLRNPPVAIK